MTTETNDESTSELPRLTRRQQRFADEYLTGVTGAEAMRRIGSKAEPARLADRAYRMLRHPQVQAYLKQKRMDLEASTQIRQERVLRRLNVITEAHIGQFYDEHGNFRPIHQLPEELAGAIESVDYEQRVVKDANNQDKVVSTIKSIKLHSPIRASDSMGRQLGWNKDVLELKAQLTVPPPTVLIAPYEDDPAENNVPGQPTTA